MNKLIFCGLFFTLLSTASNAQTKKLYYGIAFGAGLAQEVSSYDTPFTEPEFSGRVSVLTDYAVTKRFSMGLQLNYERFNKYVLRGRNVNNLSYTDVHFNLTERFPLGSGDLFMSGSIFIGVGQATLPSGENLLKQPDFNNQRMGFTATIGYVFKNGLFISSGFQSAMLSNHYKASGLKYWNDGFQLLNLGFIFNNQSRFKPAYRYKNSE
jgi:hypothetical protein